MIRRLTIGANRNPVNYIKRSGAIISHSNLGEKGQVNDPRHVIGCRSTMQTRADNVGDDGLVGGVVSAVVRPCLPRSARTPPLSAPSASPQTPCSGATCI